jgi:hypothetical protein
MKSISLLALLLLVCGQASATSLAISCQSIFGVRTSVEDILSEAQHLGEGKAASEVAKQSRLRLVDVMGVEGVLGLFGADFSTWPLFLGASQDGHLILVKSDVQDSRVQILSLKQLDISSADYLNRLDLDIDIAVRGKAQPPNYESVENWLSRTEGVFNKITSGFQKKTGHWVTADYNYDHLSWAIRTSSSMGSLKKPWIIRSTTVYTPEPDGKGAKASSPSDIAPLVHELLNAK